jgi:hypothetical protein
LSLQYDKKFGFQTDGSLPKCHLSQLKIRVGHKSDFLEIVVRTWVFFEDPTPPNNPKFAEVIQVTQSSKKKVCMMFSRNIEFVTNPNKHNSYQVQR